MRPCRLLDKSDASDGQYLADDEGLPPAQGQSYVLPAGAFFAIEGGKLARISNYYNLGDWIARVG